MSAPFQRIAVIGLGLLGGSLAQAAKKRGLAVSSVGTGRRQEAFDYALEHGIVDEVTRDPAEAVKGADLVVLATPVEAMADQVRLFAPALKDGVLITDVGSLKGVVAEMLPGLLPEGATFVGSHPMAGSHLRGIEYCNEDLFEGAPCIVLRGENEAAVARISEFWKALGSVVVLRDPEAHDAEVAWVSHAPHAVAFAFARALQAAPEQARELAGSGFRDFTRVARSEAALWADILASNRKAMTEPLQRVARELEELIQRIEAGDTKALEEFIQEARDALQALTREELE